MKNAYYKISTEEFAKRFNTSYDRRPTYRSIDEAVDAHIKKLKDLKDGQNTRN